MIVVRAWFGGCPTSLGYGFVGAHGRNGSRGRSNDGGE